MSAGEKSAKFENGLAIAFNKPASQPYSITIKAITDELSELERRVIWKWCSEWAAQSTEWTNKEDCYTAYKYYFLLPQLTNLGDKLTQAIVKAKEAIPDSQDRAILIGGSISRMDAGHDEFHASLLAMYNRLSRPPFDIKLTKPDKYKAVRERAMQSGKAQNKGTQ